jgi:hypothetical protein
MPKLFQEGKRHPLNMRTTAELRAKIEAAAAASGRSLVQEVEYRLERSFLADEVRAAVAEAMRPAVGPPSAPGTLYNYGNQLGNQLKIGVPPHGPF